MKALLCGGLGAKDAQQLVFEVQRRIPAGRSQVEMTPHVKAFRARLEAEMGEALVRRFRSGVRRPPICLNAEPPAGRLTT
jgi:hypothetical protein